MEEARRTSTKPLVLNPQYGRIPVENPIQCHRFLNQNIRSWLLRAWPSKSEGLPGHRRRYFLWSVGL